MRMKKYTNEERKAHEKYWNAIQVVNEQWELYKSDRFDFSYSLFKGHKIIKTIPVGSALLKRLKNEGGIKIKKQPKRLTSTSYAAIEILSDFPAIYASAENLFTAMAYDFEKNRTAFPIILFSKSSGSGYMNGLSFRLKMATDEYKVFSELYDRINNALTPDNLKIISGKAHGISTYANDMAKSLRRLVGLNTESLTLNSGHLTLHGKKDAGPE